MKDTVESIIPEILLQDAFKNTNFGNSSPRDIVKNTLLKYACGYASGHTIKCILVDLLLATNDCQLTNTGRTYLWAAYSEGQSF